MSKKYRPNYRLQRPNNFKKRNREDLEPEIYRSRKIYESRKRRELSQSEERQSKRYVRPSIKVYGEPKKIPYEGERCWAYCPGFWLFCPPECIGVNFCPEECTWYQCEAECGSDCFLECGSYCTGQSCSPVCSSY